MKLEFDLRELNRFANNLSQMSKLETAMKRAAKDIAKALLKWMKELTPVDEYQLINGWNGNNFAVTKNGDYFEVLIVNKDPKGIWVNDGHRVRNRKNGPYYQVKRRIQVRSPHRWQTNASDWYVFGHFFVERGILRLKDTDQIETIIMRELQKWWDSL